MKRYGVEVLGGSGTRGNLDDKFGEVTGHRVLPDSLLSRLALGVAGHIVAGATPHVRYLNGGEHGYTKLVLTKDRLVERSGSCPFCDAGTDGLSAWGANRFDLKTLKHIFKHYDILHPAPRPALLAVSTRLAPRRVATNAVGSEPGVGAWDERAAPAPLEQLVRAGRVGGQHGRARPSEPGLSLERVSRNSAAAVALGHAPAPRDEARMRSTRRGAAWGAAGGAAAQKAPMGTGCGGEPSCTACLGALRCCRCRHAARSPPTRRARRPRQAPAPRWERGRQAKRLSQSQTRLVREASSSSSSADERARAGVGSRQRLGW